MYSRLTDFLEKIFHVDARYFISGGFWLSLGQVTSILFGLITTSVFAYYLEVQEYGIYRYLLGVAIIFSIFSLTGLGQSILQATAKKYYGFYKQTLRTNLIYSLAILIISIIASSYYWLNENITLALGCFAIAVFQPLINTFQFIPALLQGSRRFKETTALSIVKIIVVSVTSITTLFITKNVLLLFVVYLASNLLVNLIGHFIYRPEISTAPKAVTEKYLRYAKHTSIRNIIANLAQRSDTILIFTQLGAIELAIYSIATVVPEQVKGSFKNLANLLLPKYAGHKNITQSKKAVVMRSLQLFIILSAITLIYFFTAPYIYQLIFPKYPEAIFYSQLSALAFPAFILIIPYSILQAQLKEGALYKITVYSSILQMTALIIGIVFFGLIGAIIARIIYRFLFMIMAYLFLQRAI